MQRLDKYLSDAKLASRKNLREMIRAGRIGVNGRTVTDVGFKVEEQRDMVTLDGTAVCGKRTVTILLNKPAGYLTAADDPRAETVMALIPEEYRRLGVQPVGRLDKATEGLLLLTNDGQLNHRLASPRHGIWKTYYAEHEGIVTPADLKAFSRGIVLGDGTCCLPARLDPQTVGRSLICVQEGKFHQVRRMMDARQLHVSYLRRVQEGSLMLGDLPLGQIRELTQEEVESLERSGEKR